MDSKDMENKIHKDFFFKKKKKGLPGVNDSESEID